MLKKLKLTKFAAVLCLFGFVLVPAAPAWADIYSSVADMKKCNEILDNFGKTSKKLGYARLGRDCYQQVAEDFPGIIEGSSVAKMRINAAKSLILLVTLERS